MQDKNSSVEAATLAGSHKNWQTTTQINQPSLIRQQPITEQAFRNKQQPRNRLRNVYDLAQGCTNNSKSSRQSKNDLEENRRPMNTMALKRTDSSLFESQTSITNTTATLNQSTTSDEDDVDELDTLQKPTSSSNANRTLMTRNHTRKQLIMERTWLDCLCVWLWRATCMISILFLMNLIVYFWPVDERYEFKAKVQPLKPRPKYEGALEVNNLLDGAQKLWQNQFHAPESMAWTSNKRAFFTGVEGGFILYVEPYAERWTVAARLNMRSLVENKAYGIKYEDSNISLDTKPEKLEQQLVDYCSLDVDIYGPRAEFEPSLVQISRCSRPLGIRLAPDDSRLYVMDPLSGLYRIDLVEKISISLSNSQQPLWRLNRVSRLLDLSRNQRQLNHGLQAPRPRRHDELFFADDIAVKWSTQGRGANETGDRVYLTDCSRRWTVRYLLWLMLENDDSGRVLEFDVANKTLRDLSTITPVRSPASRFITPAAVAIDDDRPLSFPNGLELNANGSALFVSDLNNRRILKHHLEGELKGQTELVMFVPGFSDNIRRGLDQADGTPTYWFACGCAIDDGRWELIELLNELPRVKRLLVRWLHFFGSSMETAGRWLGNWVCLQDWGVMIDAAWLKYDPYCRHGLVGQFNEHGELLRSLQAPSFGSSFKVLSEAHQVPNLEATVPSGGTNEFQQNSTIWFGSVYYSYLGRLYLNSN